MSEEEVIVAHKKSWSKRETLHRILSRHCHVLEDIGGRTPTFVVSEKENENMHEVLEKINHHLSKLGFSARLYPDEPWILQLIPDPIRQWPSPRFVVVMWLLSLFSTMFAGEKWLSSGRPDGGWFVSNASLDALIGYTIPLFLVIIVASFTQKAIAARKGVHLPHLFPIPGPAMIWWPFGIIGFASLPRSDARLWPDRSSLGNSAISAPLIMILAGMVLALVGLHLTPEIVPLSVTPLAVELPLLINLIGLSSEGELMMILKTSWAHPFTRVGMTLTFVGWVSLLPIPTFPGGRVLIARMGIPEARSGSTQVMLLLVVLLFAFLFGAFSQWSIWVLVVALCASLLITKGSDPRLPIVLDDFKGLPESDHRRIGILLFMAFMLALPAQVPFYEDEMWDDELVWSIGEDKLVIEDNWFNQTMIVSNPSLIVQEWVVSFIDDGSNSFNLSEIDCKTGTKTSDSTCEGTVNPLEDLKIKFNFFWLEQWNASSFEMTWEVNDKITKNTVVPDQSVYPVGDWEFNGDLDDPKSCITIKSSNSEPILPSQAPVYSNWDNVNSQGNISIDSNNPEVCLDGISGDDMNWLEYYEFRLDNVSFMAGYSTQNYVAIPDEGVVINNEDLMFSQSILSLELDGDCTGLGMPALPLNSENGSKLWNMSIFPTGINNYSNSNDSITLIVPEGAIISDCESLYYPEIYTVSRGPSLIVGIEDDRTQHWIGSVEFIENVLTIENPSDEDIQLNIEFDGNGPQWDVSNNIILTAGQITNISAIAPESGVSFSWLELNDEEVTLHLVNHEV
ncbi:MAG: hypothetical protein DWC06_04700 [Candidatus Poseidoniales archaeon]|nr:MAG: hypothetical protein DWC06_04700 [Candidatus Poseidoniales archaeon]